MRAKYSQSHGWIEGKVFLPTGQQEVEFLTITLPNFAALLPLRESHPSWSLGYYDATPCSALCQSLLQLVSALSHLPSQA